ncbi:MAG: polysaccharide biosynthesis tyrosine autokinase, partial [Calditrichota bacterium]
LSTQEQQALDTLSTVTQPYVRALQDTLARAQVQLTMMQSDPSIGPSHPALKTIKNRIQRFEEELRQKTQQMIQQGVESLDPITNSADIMREILSNQSQEVFLNVQLQQLGQLLDTYNQQMEQLPGKSLKLAQLQREQQLNEELYLLLHRRYEEARIEEAGQVGNLQILDAASAPSVPIKPNLKANILVGLILGLGLGVGLAFVLDMTDTVIHNSEDVERLGVRIIGRVPKSKNVRSKKQELQKGMGFPVKTHADALFVEAYRVVRTNLLFSGIESDIKTILITSPEPKDGKSVTAANLAITIAKAGKRVLLMDSDLRNPLLHRMFQISQKPGIAELLIHKSSLDVVIRPSEFEGLDIIPSGTLPPNSSELLSSPRLQEVLREIKQRYDRIIFDSPPVLAVADTMVLAALLGNTVLVIRPGKTKREAVQDSIRQITEVGGKLSGVILNAISRKNLGKYDKSYYYKNKNIFNDSDNKAWEKVINK